MSDRWYYRIFGQEFGPVSLDLVRTLVASGTIAPDDEVRDAGRSNWILACAATELCRSNKEAAIGLAVERRAVRDEWFCRGVAGDFGPLTLSDLIQLAAIGDLKPDEDVKSRDDNYWRQLRSIRRLCELLPFPDPDLTPSRTVQLSIFVDDGPPADVAAVASAIAPSCNQEDSSEVAGCLIMASAPAVKPDMISSSQMDYEDDQEPKILAFPGVQSSKLFADQFIGPAANSVVVSENESPNSSPSVVPKQISQDHDNQTRLLTESATGKASMRTEWTTLVDPDFSLNISYQRSHSEAITGHGRGIHATNNLKFNRRRNYPNAIGISIWLAIGLIMIAWMAVR